MGEGARKGGRMAVVREVEASVDVARTRLLDHREAIAQLVSRQLLHHRVTCCCCPVRLGVRELELCGFRGSNDVTQART